MFQPRHQTAHGGDIRGDDLFQGAPSSPRRLADHQPPECLLFGRMK
jgi:hypothetical protein